MKKTKKFDPTPENIVRFVEIETLGKLKLAEFQIVPSFDEKVNLNFYDGKEDLFKEDLFKEHGVEENPKRDLCYSIAWERGHAYDYMILPAC